MKIAFFDFDGVFTNGIIQYTKDNHIIKSYNVKDGTGLAMLQRENIKLVCLSGYKFNDSQKNILEHLNFDYIYFGVKDKLSVAMKICEDYDISLSECAFIGDDINDIELLHRVKISTCPSDAVKEVKNMVHKVLNKSGGQGCVREFCDYILSENTMREYTKREYANGEYTMDKYTMDEYTKDKKLHIIKEIQNEFDYQINNFNLNEIEQLANTVEMTKGNIYFCGIGKSGNMAKHCCDLLKCISFASFYLDISNLTHGDMGVLNMNDLILTFSNSGNTSEIIKKIPLFKRKKVKIIGICNNKESLFNDLCDQTIIIPFNKEIEGNINKIPTNSTMSQLIFSNILVSLLKSNVELDEYKQNHMEGTIAKDLLTINDILIIEYPKIVFNEGMELNKILLTMTAHKIGCCFFVNDGNELLGILTDGDIRRLLLKNNTVFVTIKNLNTNYYYSTDGNKLISKIQYKNMFIPLLKDKKIFGIFRI